MVRPEGGDVELAQALGGLVRRHARERLGALVEGEQRDDRQARDRADRLDRVDDLLEVVERLDREQVGAAALEHLGLLGEQIPADTGRRRLAQRADRARDEDVSAGDLARVAGQLDGGGVDPLEVVLQEMGGELAAVRAEGVRLDHVRAGVDEAHVEGDDGVRSADVGLLRAAQARDGGRDQGPHAAVGDQGRPLVEPVDEARGRHSPSESSQVGRSTEDEGFHEAAPPAILTLHPLRDPDAAGVAPETSPQGEHATGAGGGPGRFGSGVKPAGRSADRGNGLLRGADGNHSAAGVLRTAGASPPFAFQVAHFRRTYGQSPHVLRKAPQAAPLGRARARRLRF